MNTMRTLRAAVLALTVMAFAVVAAEGYSRYSRQKELARDGEQAENRGAYKQASKAYHKSGLYAVDNRTRAGLLLREAECYVLAREPYDAFTAYQNLLRSYPLYVPYEQVLPKLRRLAASFEQGEGSWFGIRNRTKAIEVYELILQETPVGSGAIEDSLALGALLTTVERPEEAITVYREALKRFPGDPQVPRMRLALGRLLVDESRTGDGDGQVARQARRELDGFIKASPDSPQRADAEFLLSLVEERRAAALYDLGEFYLRPAHKREAAARRYLAAVVRNHAGTTAAPRAEVLLASLGPEPVVPEAVPMGPEEAPATPVVAASMKRVVPRKPAAPKRPERRLLDGVLPAVPPSEGQPRTFRTLEERENVQKWLQPLGDVNDL